VATTSRFPPSALCVDVTIGDAAGNVDGVRITRDYRWSEPFETNSENRWRTLSPQLRVALSLDVVRPEAIRVQV